MIAWNGFKPKIFLHIMYANSVSQTFLIDEDFCDFSLDFFLSSTFLGSNSFLL